MSNPEGTTTPPKAQPRIHPPTAPIEPLASLGLSSSAQVNAENWTNLKELLKALQQASAITGLGPVKRVIEGLVELIVLYEDVAQGQKEFHQLRLQLECIFDELRQHLLSSLTITMSMDNICWSIWRELELAQAEQAKQKEGKLGAGGNNARVVLECYGRIEGHLQRLARNANLSIWKIANEVATESHLQKLISSLWERYNSNKANELQRGLCTAGTRMSVLMKMHHWAIDQNAGNIFWLSGMAGTGKTTIAYTLCKQLDVKDKRILCASFFCSRLVPECRDVGRIVPSIAYQLARSSRPFRYALSQVMEQDPDAYTQMPQMQFESLIMQPFSDVKVREAFPTNMVVVLDALDECDDLRSTKQILDILMAESKNLPLKFVVSSRPEAAIRDQMEKNASWVDTRVVLHELDTIEVQTDIRTYLKTELEPISPSDLEIEQLVARAGVLFIYAATVIRYVGYDDFGWDPRSRLDVVLGTSDQNEEAPTEDIDDLYATILRAAFDNPMLRKKERDNMKLILGTVICARQPLTVEALNNLLQLGGVARVQAAIRPLWSVLHVMGPSMIVTTLHASFPDYLLDPSRSGTWFCDAASHHHLLAQRCFECIQGTKPQFNICRLESSYVLDNEVADLDARVQRFISTELRYACQFWSSHLDATKSGTVSDLMPVLLQFLATHLLLWMEIRSLTKTLPATPGELTAAKRWATRRGMTYDAIELLSDSWRLASTFVSSPVSQSTPHLYISMLPLLPPGSPIRKHYMGRFRGTIGVEGTALIQRKDELLAEWKLELDVLCIACSPNGTRVAIGGMDHFLKRSRLYLLDVFGGSLLHDLSQGDESRVCSVAFSPDNTRLVVGSESGDILGWGVTDGEIVLGPVKAHTEELSSIIYSHNGWYIISASIGIDRTIRIWDALSGEPALTQLITHPSRVICMSISSDDTRLVSGCRDGAIRVWDTLSGQLILGPIEVDDSYINAVTFTPDDSHIVSALFNGNIWVRDVQTGQIVLNRLRDPGRNVRLLSASPEGTTIASASDVDGFKVWDAISGKLLLRLGPYSNDTKTSGLQAIYSPDSTHIIFATSDGTIRLLDAQTAAMASDPRPPHSITNAKKSIDISPNSQHVAFGSDTTVSVWDLTEEGELDGPIWEISDNRETAHFSPDGTRILSFGYHSGISQWDTRSGAVYGTPIHPALKPDEALTFAVYSQDGSLIIFGTSYRMISIWDSSTGQPILEPINNPVLCLECYSRVPPDGSIVFVSYGHRSIDRWDMRNPQVLVYRHKGLVGLGVASIGCSPDGLFYAKSSMDGKISLRNVHTGEKIPGAFKGHTRDISHVGFSSDGTRFVSASYDNTIHVWDIETRQSLFGPLNGHSKGVASVSISPNGEFVISTSKDSPVSARLLSFV